MKEIFQTFLDMNQNELSLAIENLKQKTPAPMNVMLEKQPREEALQKRAERKKIVTQDVPPNVPGEPLFTVTRFTIILVLYIISMYKF